MMEITAFICTTGVLNATCSIISQGPNSIELIKHYTTSNSRPALESTYTAHDAIPDLAIFSNPEGVLYHHRCYDRCT
ncbi:hypothetical protein BYT27DRAFT_7192159 [Phlegmacium glaucopus]|nr:hypothetical protein BYT27DRAFT_7192159 [Phlegmacium glaucopus]